MEELFAMLNYWHWFVASIILVIIDVLLGTSFFFLWLGAAAATVGTILVFVNISWEYQFLIFAIEAIVSTFFWRKYLKKNRVVSDKPSLNRRSEQYVGRTFTLEEPIVNGRGKIKVDDSSWKVQGEDMPAGSKITVDSVDGVVLHVKKIDN